MAKKHKPKIVVCPVKPTPPAARNLARRFVRPSKAERISRCAKMRWIKVSTTAFQSGLVVGSQSADDSEIQSTAALSFTAGSSKITSLKFTNPGDIQVAGVPGDCLDEPP